MTKTHRRKTEFRAAGVPAPRPDRLAEARCPGTSASAVGRDGVLVGPDASELALMADLEIAWQDGAYWFKGDRYERLETAATYARQLERLAPSEIAPLDAAHAGE